MADKLAKQEADMHFFFGISKRQLKNDLEYWVIKEVLCLWRKTPPQTQGKKIINFSSNSNKKASRSKQIRF